MSDNDGFENYHSVPLEHSYKSLIKSNRADMKNTGGRFGGAITAARTS
jgi:Leucyl aminopeptidase